MTSSFSIIFTCHNTNVPLGGNLLITLGTEFQSVTVLVQDEAKTKSGLKYLINYIKFLQKYPT